MTDRRIIIGSRGSELARLQARLAIAELARDNPSLHLEPMSITTEGDRRKRVSLEELGGTGVFVKELEEALLERKIDMAVHSLKDMPTAIPEGLHIAAVMERADPRDALVSPKGTLAGLPSGARIGTSSPRRAAQLLAQRPDIEIHPLRGNIDTRLKRASSDEMDGVIMAAAALIRLGMEHKITECLDADAFVPAVGQGALAIETRDDDDDMNALAATLDHRPSRICVDAERAFLQALGGGCRAPIAALAVLEGDTIRLRGMVAHPDRIDILRAELEADASAPEEAGRMLADKMTRLGAASLLKESR